MEQRRLEALLGRIEPTSVKGDFFRHVSLRYQTLVGSDAGGRWGPPGEFSVLYLGRPRENVIAEAYRRLIDPVEGMTPELVAPRRLFTCKVSVSGIVDLRDKNLIEDIGATADGLMTSYEQCQRIGAAVYRRGFTGVLAPSAAHLGETLALFDGRLDGTELPTITREEVWLELPPDPRH